MSVASTSKMKTPGLFSPTKPRYAKQSGSSDTAKIVLDAKDTGESIGYNLK
jgi:hypothetical protein